MLADSADAEDTSPPARDAADGAADADGLLERCLDHELGWWATQEIGDLLAETGRPEPRLGLGRSRGRLTRSAAWTPSPTRRLPSTSRT